ncbi:helix-turn-helix domain-containing protein [Salinactinospora qingdaonensis]|uniref:GAF domain-containing protein n=1 Tax=Salinactinospora qingdaonensis TaxID=702744 RepID=A0ABP7FM71_9ACTN
MEGAAWGDPEMDDVMQSVARVHEELELRRDREGALTALIDAVRDLAEQQTQTDLQRMLTRRARLLMRLDIAFIEVESRREGRYIHAPDGHVSTMLHAEVATVEGGGLGQWALSAQAPAWTPDYLSDERFTHDEVADDMMLSEGVRGLIAIPLSRDTESSTILFAGSRSVRHFSVDEVSLMSSFGEIAGGLLRRMERLEKAEAARDDLQARLELEGKRGDLGSFLPDRLLSNILSGAELTSLITEIAKHLGAAVRLLSAHGDELCSTGQPSGGDWPTHAAVSRGMSQAHASGEPVRLDEHTWAALARAEGEDLGIVLFVFDSPVGKEAVEQIRVAAQTLSITALLCMRGSVSVGQLRNELLGQLVLEASDLDRRSMGWREQRALRLGLDLGEPQVIVVVETDEAIPAQAVSWANSFTQRRQGLRTVQGDRLVLLIPGTASGTAAREVATELQRVLGLPITAAGAGPFTGGAEVHTAYREACRTLDAILTMYGKGTAASADELGFFGTLLSDRQDISGFIDSTIGSLLAYDRQHGTELLATLEAYFATGNSPTHAAKRLHVHPNTVSRRLERIGELLGPEWQQPERSLELYLALRLVHLHHLLQRNSTGVRSALEED